MYVKLCTIFTNMASYDEIKDNEYMHEVGCLMWYLALDKVMRFYSFHCPSIAWASYMLRWYYVGMDYHA